jgi:Na+-transporting methylmalonyl-CoA/oxaloacetate decarboxylase gamma subunit
MEHMDWGLKMTVLGMGLVFALLALLWGLLTLVLALDKEEVEAPESAEDDAAGYEAADEPQVAAGGLPADLVSAILVATLKHKNALRGGTASMMQTTCAGNQPSPWAAAGRARQTNNWISRGK